MLDNIVNNFDEEKIKPRTIPSATPEIVKGKIKIFSSPKKDKKKIKFKNDNSR